MHADTRTSIHPQTIITLGLGSQARAALERLFASREDAAYVFVERFEDAGIGIVDLDAPQARELFQDFRRRLHGQVLVLSAHDPDMDDVIWLPRPIKPSSLLSALAGLAPRTPAPRVPASSPQPNVSNLNTIEDVATDMPERSCAPANDAPDAAQSATSEPGQTQTADADIMVAAEPHPAATTFTRPAEAADPLATTWAAGLAKTERRRHPSYGNLSNDAYADPERSQLFFYDPAEYFQGKLQAAMAAALDSNQPLLVRMNGSEKCLTIFPDGDRVQSDVKEHFLRSMSMVKGSGRTVTTELLPPGTQPAPAVGELRLQSRIGLLWKVALWTAIGRVPKGTRPEHPVQLVYWPNFTRILIPHYGIQIASLWSQRPATLLETAAILDIDYRYVFSFYSAAIAIGAVAQANSGTYDSREYTPAGQRGILGRLLIHLGARD
ncbi:MAG: hypothetical protein R3F42_02320 [Pseudomonadota bacterium]